MKMYKITSLLVGFTLIAGLAGATTLTRFQIGRLWNTGQTAGLNRSLTEVETAITTAEESITTASLTNGATLTATSDVYIISGIGGANDTTNTVTLANAVNGQRLTLVVAAASTNLITIADSGNAALSSAWLGDANDVISLIGVSTNWVQTSESDN